jgi:hypothetical protein
MDKIGEAAEKVVDLFDNMDLTPEEGMEVLGRLMFCAIKVTLDEQAEERRRLSRN